MGHIEIYHEVELAASSGGATPIFWDWTNRLIICSEEGKLFPACIVGHLTAALE